MPKQSRYRRRSRPRERRIARFVGLDEPRHLIFTANGTDSLNLAIHGLLRPGDHVVTTDVEHNSVLRPLEHLVQRAAASRSRESLATPRALSIRTTSAARFVRTRVWWPSSHASNVTGAIQPVGEIARVAHEAGALVLCDAAKSLGHMPLDVRELGVDLLAAAGHKGLLGPLGTGVLAIGPRAVDELRQHSPGWHGHRERIDRAARASCPPSSNRET